MGSLMAALTACDLPQDQTSTSLPLTQLFDMPFNNPEMRQDPFDEVKPVYKVKVSKPVRDVPI